ncbi:putative teichuronic acid biosynthesis glycosyltransferase TuaH [Methanobrevibacter cuticularis]|uniref:Putative teichuronic acid biosynthesis glycosyltransferase TuaH n=1 Tax=Methanobrevibacter cuticularis TaxID=47311 RepID=A0A166CQI3_9EURY|nr:glycosyltransferase [Methanobrevibacter cuticularis]KZX16047.1 putative teichuronic acid biosynthesis glycosyltransferase TuaH [Methanobrevibacter cuticularis]
MSLNTKNILSKQLKLSCKNKLFHIFNNKINKKTTKQIKSKNILFFSIIDYKYKYRQRPQHITDYFGNKDYIVHYFNTSFEKESTKVNKINKNINNIFLKFTNKNSKHFKNSISTTNFLSNFNEIKESIDSYIENNNIENGIIFVEFPNWAYLTEYLKEKYNFKIVFDVLDEYEGFHPDDEVLLDSFRHLIGLTDLVITTSNFLSKKLKNLNNNVKIIRNGTEFNHFNNHIKPYKNEKPIIGYYGALSYWVDFEKIYHAATKRPNYDFVIIGDFKDSKELFKEKLKNLSNVKFLGKIDYYILPKYLNTFDVAIIPFKSDIDLIKATNPVKFYEYLSMGKKIVSTDIPELFDFKDLYVYTCNGNEDFLKSIDLCVDKKDNLASFSEKIAFAEKNDWKHRCNMINKYINDLYV